MQPIETPVEDGPLADEFISHRLGGIAFPSEVDYYGIQARGDVMPSVRVLAVTNLGDNNVGNIGPEGSTEELERHAEEIVPRLTDPNHVKKPTNRWVCVDRRTDPSRVSVMPEGMADPQTAGGMPLTYVSIRLMESVATMPISHLVAEETRRTIEHNIVPAVHGAEQAGKNGCGLNAAQRDILRENAENKAIVLPLALQQVELLEMTPDISESDINSLLETGAINAANDALWDATTEEKVDIAMANGAEYDNLHGVHDEGAVRVDLSEYAYEQVDAFNASFKLLKNHFYTLAEHGLITRHQAARETMAAILHNIGISKHLSNGNMPVVVVA